MLYRNRILDDTLPPPDAQLVSQLERSLGCKLPDDYRQFIETCNGGYGEYEIDFEVRPGLLQTKIFGTLYSVEQGAWTTLPYELEQSRQHEGFPLKQVLPFAQDGGSSKLFLDLRDGYRVVAFLQGLPAWTGLPQQDSLITVASSFNEYLDSLYLSDDMITFVIEHFDPKHGDPEAMAEWLDSGSTDWRTKHATLWQRHVIDPQDG